MRLTDSLLNTFTAVFQILVDRAQQKFDDFKLTLQKLMLQLTLKKYKTHISGSKLFETNHYLRIKS